MKEIVEDPSHFIALNQS